MKALKKYISVIIAFCFVLSLTACGGSSDSTTASSEEATQPTTQAEEEEKAFDASPFVNDDGFYKDVKASDIVTLPEIEKFEIPHAEWFITDEELKEEIDVYRQDYSYTVQNKERAVVDGDTVNIDYTGSVDGKEFSNGATNGQGTTVTIGVTSYIDDFLEQLIGHKPGETFDINVTFPDEYPNNPDLAGKDALFVTTINYIEEEVLPEYTDEFVKTNFEEPLGLSTTSDMDAFVTKTLQENKIYNFIYDKLFTGTTFGPIPEIVENYIYGYYKWQVTHLAGYYGVDVETYLGAIGYENYDAYYASLEDVVEGNKKQDMIIQAVAETIGYKITNEDVKAFFVERYGDENYEESIEGINQPTLYKSLLPNLVMKELAKRAVLLEDTSATTAN